MSDLQPRASAAPDWAQALLDEAQGQRLEGRRPLEPASFAPASEDPFGHFQASTHFEALFRAAIEGSGIVVADSPLVLVLGSGSGANAVAPCLRLFRGARILATDQTDRDFDVLGRHLQESGADDRVVLLQMKPDEPVVAKGTFDLVAGASVLHRVIDPDKVLEATARVLKPGGHAIFLEPFDGYGLIRLAFERILAEAELRKAPLSPRLAAVIGDSVADIAARTMPDRSVPAFAELERKWLFSRESITAAACNLGFADVRFQSHHDHATLYRDVALMRLREMAGAEVAGELPNWAVEVLDGFDRAMPPPVKRLLMLEGSIVLTR